MTELARIDHPTDIATVDNDTSPRFAAGAMRLVEWAEEAQAAHHLANALVRTPFAGSWKGDIDGATAAILKGAEVGLTPVTALGAFDNIQGQPAPKAITLRALVQSHGHDLEIIEETNERAVARYRRNGKGEWLTTSFTIADAERMRLTGKDNWVKQPGAMLVARVTSKAARLVASDVILGIGYSAEEIIDQGDYRQLPVSPASEPTAPAAERMVGILAATDTPPPSADAPGAEPPGADGEAEGITSSQLKKIGACMKDLGITERSAALRYVGDVIGREVSSRNDLTKDEASRVIDALERDQRGEAPLPDPHDGNDPWSKQ